MCTHIFATKILTNLRRLEEQGDPLCGDIVTCISYHIYIYIYIFKFSYGGNNERSKCLFI